MIQCRKCDSSDLELTANGRVRTHPAESGQGNCPGGSDLPRGVDHEEIQPMKVSR